MKPIWAAGLVTILCGLAASPAFAVNVRDCDETASVVAIMEPWEQNTRAFYNGSVRVALLDTGGEPVCCSQHLLILAPDKTSEMGDRFCRIVSNHEGLGFAGIGFAHLVAKYEEGKGLLITFPYTLYVDGITNKAGTGRVRVMLDRGTVVKE